MNLPNAKPRLLYDDSHIEDSMTLRKVASTALYTLIGIAIGVTAAILIWPFLVFYFPELAR